MTGLLAFIPTPPGDRIWIGPLPIRFYGLLIALGVLAAVYLTRRRYAARGGDPDLVDRTAVVVAVGLGFLGACLAYVSTHLDRFADRPWGGAGLLSGYGLGRFLIELLRTDTTYRLLRLSRNNWVALAVCLLGFAGPAWRTLRPSRGSAT